MDQPQTSPYRYQFSAEISLAAALEHFDALTFPRLSRELRTKAIRQPLVGVLVTQAGQNAGLVLAERRPDNDGALIRSLLVVPAQRRQGLGRGLLHVLERELAAQGCPHVDIAYRSDWSARPVIEHLLGSDGWLPPKVHLYQYRCNAQEGLNASGVGKLDLPEGFSYFPWSELTPADRQSILARQANGGWYTPTLDPFQLPGLSAFGNSLGLRSAGQVVGWMITHRTGKDAIQYTSLFTSPDLKDVGRSRLGFALVIEATRRQLPYGIPTAIFQVEADNRPMKYFTEQYLARYMQVSELRVARKILVAS